jgi:tetratricopeptide (TPR) repeat protein
LLERGDYEAARSALEQALAIARAASNRRIEANCLAGLGDLAYRQRRYDEAAVLLGEAEATLRELDDRPLLADLLCTRGLVDLLRADRLAAEAALVEAEQMARSMNAGSASTLNRAMERLRTALAR